MMKMFKCIQFDAEGIPFLKKNSYYGQIHFALGLSNIKQAKLLVYNAKEKVNVVVHVPFDRVTAN